MAVPIATRIAAERVESGPSLADLARMAADEEWKRRLAAGGGGGGSPPMKSPTQMVLYSIGLINEQMRALYQSVIAAFERNQANAPGQVQQATEAATLPAGVREFVMNIGTALRMIADLTQRSGQQIGDTAKLAKELSSNALNAAMLSISGWVSRTLKLLGLSNADDDNFEAEELADKQAATEEEMFFPGLSARLFGEGDNQSNGRSVISHIQNVADQMNRVVASLLRK